MAYKRPRPKRPRHPPTRIHAAPAFTATNPLTHLGVVSHEECMLLLRAAKISYTHHYMRLGQQAYHDLASACGAALNHMALVGEAGNWRVVMKRVDRFLREAWEGAGGL